MKKHLPLILLILILVLAAFLRLYRISDYMTFLGDEGRDVLVVKDMLEGNLTLLGPRSSAGDFFMGPAYYYLMTPFLWLFRLDPVGPAVMVALFGVATVWLIYFVGKKFFDAKAGLFAAALYSVSPLVVNYSHSSWNPNVLPFFSLLFIYFLYKAVSSKKWKYFILAGVLLGISLQLHYIALFLGVVGAVYIAFGNKHKNKKIYVLATIKSYVQFFIGFVIGLSPFLAFEFRHQFLNIRGILDLIFAGTAKKGLETHMSFFQIVGDVFFRIFAKFVFFFPSPERYDLWNSSVLKFFGLAIVIIAIISVIFLLKMKNYLVKWLLVFWLFVGVLLFGFYKQSIYDYVFAFISTLPFLLVGNLIYQLQNKKKLWIKGAAFVLFLGIFLFNLSGMPFRYEPNRQRDQVRKISEFVISQANNKPFNFALITGGNSDHAYRYYFEILGHKPVVLENDMNDPKRKSVTDQLLIVCEDTSCQPLGNSLWEVSGFGRAEIEGKWDVSVVQVYKLKHYKEVRKL
jgi:4-amino-4-deoxy-L-arabinose transferase-like glycosyltransferase